MFKHWLLPLILLSQVLFALPNSILEDEDPTIFHNVNVITGQLNICMNDTTIQGPSPYPIYRTYTSGSPIQPTSDLTVQAYRMGWVFGGGWSLLPHTYILHRNDPNLAGFMPSPLYISEKNGNLVEYVIYYKKGHKRRYASKAEPKISGDFSARYDPSKNKLYVNEKDLTATLYRPDGSISYFTFKYKNETYFYFWLLEKEILPNKHQIIYTYSDDNKRHLLSIELLNPTGDITYGSVRFDPENYATENRLSAQTSDGTDLSYQMMLHKHQRYLEATSHSCLPSERYLYADGRKKTGARLGRIHFSDRERLATSYYKPETTEEEKKFAKHPDDIAYQIDKVKKLEIQDPETGELHHFASFSYTPGSTTVEDSQHNITKYHHRNGLISMIEYFTPDGNLHSTVRFNWVVVHLASKSLYDSNGQCLLTKKFSYDRDGNVIKEELLGQFTGEEKLENLIKTYEYYPKSYLLKSSTSEGLTTEYTYLADTDLPSSRIIRRKERILLRQFFIYDGNNILTQEIEDDGSSLDKDDLSDVTQRTIKTNYIELDTGLCLATKHSYIDLETLEEVQISKSNYTYSTSKQIIAEAVYDSSDTYQYTLYNEYDPFGNVIKKTSPSGRINLYEYDEYGYLKFAKEIGKEGTHYKRDLLGRPIESISGEETQVSAYDIKGRLITQIDQWGNTTHQMYDPFGRCIETVLPSCLDEKGEEYAPKITMGYDLVGNLISYSNPRGETTRTEYNSKRQPLKVIHPDGRIQENKYTLEGKISQCVQPDGSLENYTYDSFQRRISKTLISPEGETLSKEKWEYGAYHLLSYTDPRGSTTRYTYDGAGRKIAQETEGRLTTFTYDSLGHLASSECAGRTLHEIHNIEGELIEKWESDGDRCENRMHFLYDIEGRPTSAIRITSQGKAIDRFEYDPKGQLTSHTDPKGARTTWEKSSTYINQLGQHVPQKITTSPIGNRTLEVYDASGRLSSLEKQNSRHETVSLEEYYYDRAGNLSLRTVTIYEETKQIKNYSTRWEYNNRGWLIQETENDEKATRYVHDSNGRVVEKTTPSTNTMFFRYDGLDRLLEIKDQDRTIHYAFNYDHQGRSVEAHDHIHNRTWKQIYDVFGELIKELLPNGTCQKWSYDALGRCTLHTLPDTSAIEYRYDPLHMQNVTRISKENTPLYWHQYTSFDPNGHVQEEKFISGLGVQTTVHNILERPERRSNPWDQSSIRYDSAGLVTDVGSSLLGPKSYSYDSLEQLTGEGSKKYHFDSLGNPCRADVNFANQITRHENIEISYDRDGNLSEQRSQELTKEYEFDALGRLVSSHVRGSKRVRFEYDPFGRLYTKQECTFRDTFWDPEEPEYYFYDGGHEIGTIDKNHRLISLKVNGLGTKGDLGAAIAIEIEDKIYLPLHDFYGNIIALVNSDGLLIETHVLDAFGRKETASISPWGYQSKREEGEFIYFGARFYSPSLGRFISPDPAGSVDSPNLYLFLRNSTPNRLDLFGFQSDGREMLNVQVTVPHFRTPEKLDGLLIPCRILTDHVQADAFVSSSLFHKLQFTPEEFQAGKFNLLNHFQELFPRDGASISLITSINGINTTLDQAREKGYSILEKIPENPLLLVVHNPTQGVPKDVGRYFSEFTGTETPMIDLTRQLIVALSDNLCKVNPQALWLHINHSEGGLVSHRAIEGLNDQQKNRLKEQMTWLGLAPGYPIDDRLVLSSLNVYSESDNITGWVGKQCVMNESFYGEILNSDLAYKIKFVPASTSDMRNRFTFSEHDFLGKTLQKELTRSIHDLRGKHGIYQESR